MNLRESYESKAKDSGLLNVFRIKCLSLGKGYYLKAGNIRVAVFKQLII